jgi:hypothetical protein
VDRYRRRMIFGTLNLAAGVLLGPAALVLTPGTQWLLDVTTYGWKGRHNARVQRVPASLSPTGRALVLPRGGMIDAHLAEGAGGELLLRVPLLNQRNERFLADFRDDAARTVLSRTMLMINRDGASRGDVRHAVSALADAPSAEAYIRTVARNRGVLGGQRAEGTRKLTPTGLRALEMALHEEQERRALEGELAALEAMWRQAEEIAAIADALPAVPAPEPPRMIAG